MKTLPPAEGAVVRRLVAEHKERPGPLIEILHAIQAALGFVPEGAVPAVAEGLNLSRAEPSHTAAPPPASLKSAGA
jgi:NADH:ubiquinone oxidoreductase subunit E